MHRTFRYRLYATAEQEERFSQFAGACRFLYNLALEQRERMWTYYRDNGTPLNCFQQINELPQLRAEVDWLKDVSRECQDATLMRLDRAFSAFYAGRGRYPRYQQRGVNDSFQFKGLYCTVTAGPGRWSYVRLPKIGKVKFRDTRPIRGNVRTVTVRRSALGWHVSFACLIEDVAPAKPLENSVGIDRGVANTLALSTGELLSLPDTRSVERRRRAAQRDASRRVRGSRRHALAKKRAASASARIARIRKDWQHKAALSIACRFGHVALEDLNIVGMTAKGRGKRGLNRSIMHQGWGSFARILAYKLEERGGTLVTVNPAYTSQTCSWCGTIDKLSRESQSRFVCRNCGFEEHADINASLNILRRSTARVEGTRWRPGEARTIDAEALEGESTTTLRALSSSEHI
jgi:putative transposase